MITEKGRVRVINHRKWTEMCSKRQALSQTWELHTKQRETFHEHSKEIFFLISLPTIVPGSLSPMNQMMQQLNDTVTRCALAKLNNNLQESNKNCTGV